MAAQPTVISRWGSVTTSGEHTTQATEVVAPADVAAPGGCRGDLVMARNAMPCSVSHALAAARAVKLPNPVQRFELDDEPGPVLAVDGEQVCGR